MTVRAIEMSILDELDTDVNFGRIRYSGIQERIVTVEQSSTPTIQAQRC